MNVRTLNPDLLKVARQSRALSQAQLAEKSGVSQAAISKAESGLLPLGEEFVQKLATALKYPVSLFYELDRIFGLPISLQYRKRASVGQRALEQLEAEVNLRLMHLRRLLRSIDFEAEFELPSLDCDELGGPDAVAERLRRTWLIPTGPIRNLVEVVERAGCVVFSCEFHSLGVDGLTLSPLGMPHCIFINSELPADRQRFTIAHELGHLVMHRGGSQFMEEEANAFAAAFLMPHADIAGDLAGGLSLPRLAGLKRTWRVSMAALIYRAHTIGAINENQNTSLWRQMATKGFRKREPVELDFPPEEPGVLPGLIQMHQADLGYSVAELAKVVGLHEPEFVRGYRLEPRRAHLRLVV